MEVKIGVQHAPREIVLESGQSAEEVERAVSDGAGRQGASCSASSDEHGRKVLVPADRLAYVEIGEPTAPQGGLRRLCSSATQATADGPVRCAAGPSRIRLGKPPFHVQPSHEEELRSASARV